MPVTINLCSAWFVQNGEASRLLGTLIGVYMVPLRELDELATDAEAVQLPMVHPENTFTGVFTFEEKPLKSTNTDEQTNLVVNDSRYH